MFKTSPVIHSVPSNARTKTLPIINEKPNRQIQCRLGKPSIQSFVHGAPMDEVTGFGFGSQPFEPPTVSQGLSGSVED